MKRVANVCGLQGSVEHFYVVDLRQQHGGAPLPRRKSWQVLRDRALVRSCRPNVGAASPPTLVALQAWCPGANIPKLAIANNFLVHMFDEPSETLNRVYRNEIKPLLGAASCPIQVVELLEERPAVGEEEEKKEKEAEHSDEGDDDDSDDAYIRSRQPATKFALVGVVRDTNALATLNISHTNCDALVTDQRTLTAILPLLY